MAELDLRIVTVGIQVNNQIKSYTGLQIAATGIKYTNANQNECEVVIENLDKATQDYILTETSPFNLNRTAKLLTLDAGRISYGTSRVFVGNIITSSVSQPPDVKLTLKCLTGNFLKGQIATRFLGTPTPASQLTQYIASDLQIGSDFQATDKIVGNYSFSGAAVKQVDILNQMGNYDAYIDDETLVVKDRDLPLRNTIKIVNIDTGMIGIPMITEHGVKVKFLLDNQTRLGGLLRLTSIMFPSLNGDYIIYKLGFEITSRDVPFYYIAECKRIVS